jgi:NADH:ubiquinone oxidoreductase subunit 5 (subunit L)/multisubunit Na+/H+ antiporter MnhA subunit
MVTSPFPVVCAWTLLLTPLVAALAILLFGIHNRRLSATLAVGGLLVSLACPVSLFIQHLNGSLPLPFEASVNWVVLPDLQVPFGLLTDPLSL